MHYRFGQKVAVAAGSIIALMAVSPLSAFAQSAPPVPISSVPLMTPSQMETQPSIDGSQKRIRSSHK